MEEVPQHSSLAERVLEVTNSKGTREHVVKHGNIVEPKTQLFLSSTASKDNSNSRREYIHRQLGKRYQRKIV